MITITGLSKTFGTQTLFEEANLQLNAGGCYGIVGANGAGKSTLLRIIAGQETESAGEVNLPRNARMGILEQDHFQYDAVPILDVVMMGDRILWDAMVEKEALLARAHEDFDDDRYAALEDIVLSRDGYGLESRAGEILEGLGIPTRQHHLPLSALSGGYKLRVLLGKTLAATPDILLLDEPTNHLDIIAIRWMERFLSEFSGCAVVVSHDHRFLDATCSWILDVDYERVIAYRGNYTAFNQQKGAERERQESEIDKREKEIADHKAFIARFKAKATKARQANSRQKRLDKVVIESLPQSSRCHPRFSFVARRPSGRDVLEVKGLERSYGDKQVLFGIDLEVHRGDRLAVIGANGIGKSTLLRILAGLLPADTGTATWGYEVDLGWFPQDHREALGDPEQTVLECMWEALPAEGIGSVLGSLAQVLFSREDTNKKVGNLSGGEAARLLFARIAARRPTVLLLDEPTNHLDLEGIEALADGLAAYDGTILFVSHDRWFVDRLATRILEISEQGVRDFRGGYAELLASEATDHLDADAVLAQEEAARREAKRAKKRG